MSTSTALRGAVPTGLLTTESLDLLRGAQVGRICIDLDGYPVAFPVNYVVDDTIDGARIVIRTAPTTAIGRYCGRAALEVDRFDLAAGEGWSVIVRGQLSTLVGRKPNDPPRPFVSSERTQWMELTIVSVSGRAFTTGGSGFSVDWQLDPVTPFELHLAHRSRASSSLGASSRSHTTTAGPRSRSGRSRGPGRSLPVG